MPTAAPNPCDSLEVDLSRTDVDVEIWQSPCIDVELLHPDVTIEFASVANQGPKGDQGDPGEPGDTGSAGPPGSPGLAATISVGTTTTGAPGTAAAVANSGSSSTAIFDFSIPRGDTGAKGDQGQGIYIKGSVPTSASLPMTGNTPGDVWIALDTNHGWSWNGTAWVDIGPLQGPAGTPGAPGTPATATAGTTTTGAPGSPANVTNVGTLSNAVFDFAIPRGADGVMGVAGAPGSPGAAATIAAGPTVTGAPGSNALVTNTGSSSAAVFAFTIPRGDVGATGATGATGAASTVPGPTGPTGPTGAASTIPGPPGPSTPSANAGNLLTAGSDSLLYLPPSAIDPEIWSVRLRSFNAVGNPNFEVSQRNLTNSVSTGMSVDRWWPIKTGTMVYAAVQGTASGAELVVPGTNFQISRSFQRITLSTAQASLAAGDYLIVSQGIEGLYFRELQYDVHSISILCRSSVAGLKFSLSLRDSTNANSLCKLCTIPSANTWTLITLPNLPIWPGGGTFSNSPGVASYNLNITLAAGTTFTAAAANTWQTGSFFGAPGMDNFASKAVNSTFDLGFVQHEPGSVCSTLQDKPFSQNFDECLRYYCKSMDYAQMPGTAIPGGPVFIITPGTLSTAVGNAPFPKPMAKAPTVTAYNAAGTAGGANMVGGAAVTVNSVASMSTRITSVTLSANQTAGWGCQFQYTADTGW